VVRWLSLGGAAALTSCRSAAPASTPAPAPKTSQSLPTLFLAHGAPTLLDDAQWVSELQGWARTLRAPRAVLMVSAHWATQPACLGATSVVPLVYDFSGFPERFYQLSYPAPGAPELARRVEGLFEGTGVPVASRPERGLDHGAFVPLLCMYPDAKVPVLQLSLPGLAPADAFALGRRLAPLRDEGVLIIGSGFLTHNLREGFTQGTPGWATEFDAWVQEALSKRDVDALVDLQHRAPAAARAHPTVEHYLPVLVALGAAADGAKVDFPITGFWQETSFTRRSVQFG
jgi:4,5-DOPA dioxygenase extradiol